MFSDNGAAEETLKVSAPVVSRIVLKIRLGLKSFVWEDVEVECVKVALLENTSTEP